MFVIQEIHTNQKLPIGGAKGSKTRGFTPPAMHADINIKEKELHWTLLK